jgi:hypothetical protein
MGVSNAQMDQKEKVCDSLDCIHVAQYRAAVYTEMNLRVPQKWKNLLNNLATVNFSRKTLPY